jgi:hypothetical protein
MKLTDECKHYKKYDGVAYPRCNDGKPCKACLELYELFHPITVPAQLQEAMLEYKLKRDSYVRPEIFTPRSAR